VALADAGVAAISLAAPEGPAREVVARFRGYRRKVTVPGGLAALAVGKELLVANLTGATRAITIEGWSIPRAELAPYSVVSLLDRR